MESRIWDGSPDEDLFASFVAEGDQDAFSTLIARHSVELLAYIRQQYVRDDAIFAEDVLQELWLRIARHPNRLDVSLQFLQCAKHLARLVALDCLRKRRKTAFRENGSLEEAEGLPMLASVDTTLSQVIYNDLLAYYLRLVETLSPNQGDALRLIILGFQHEEAAAQLGIELGALHGRLQAARRNIRKLLEETEYS